jgi:hypothetical protein
MTFKVGDKVRVKASVDEPSFAWGEVSPGDVGTVRTLSGIDSEMIVDFPNQRGWMAESHEMELVVERRKAAQKVLAYGILTKDGKLHSTVTDRDKARSIKAKLGGKPQGVTIFTLQADKEIR